MMVTVIEKYQPESPLVVPGIGHRGQWRLVWSTSTIGTKFAGTVTCHGILS